jgi:hypothetical protein
MLCGEFTSGSTGSEALDFLQRNVLTARNVNRANPAALSESPKGAGGEARLSRPLVCGQQPGLLLSIQNSVAAVIARHAFSAHDVTLQGAQRIV